MARSMSVDVNFYGHSVSVYPRDIADNLPEGTNLADTAAIEEAIKDYIHTDMAENNFPDYRLNGVEEVVEAVQSLLEERNAESED